MNAEPEPKPMKYLYGIPPSPMLVLCPCGEWHHVPFRATEEVRFRLDCGLFAHLTFEEPGPFIQFCFKGHSIPIVDFGAGAEHLYVKLEER